MKVYTDKDVTPPEYCTFCDGDDPRESIEVADGTDLSKYIVEGGVLRQMTSEELLAIANEEAAVVIKAQIAGLELTVTARRIREATLTTEGKAWLQNVDDQIAVLRTQL